MIATVAAGVLLFARLTGLLLMLPGVSTRAVPGYARVLVAVPLTLLLLPAAAREPVAPTLSVLFAQVVGEAMLGIAMGFAVTLVFGSLAMAAEVISAQSGMAIAAMLDPLTDTQPGAAGILVSWLGTAVFFGENLHLHCIEALAASLRALPLGHASGVFQAGDLLVPLAGVALTTGIQLAGPITAFVFCVNLGLSLLGRMAPGLQIFFAIGPTITVAASLALLAISLPAIMTAWYTTMPHAFEVLAQLLGPPR